MSVATERTGSRAGELGLWVLFVAIGAGTTVVIAIVLLLDRFAGMSGSRRPPRGQLMVPRAEEVFHLPPPAGLSREPAAPVQPAPAHEPFPTEEDTPAPGPDAPRTRRWRPHVAVPHVALPHVALPHVALPHVALPHVNLRSPRPAVGEPETPQRVAAVLRRSLARAMTATMPAPADTSARTNPAQAMTSQRVRNIRGLAGAVVPVALAGRTVLDPGWLLVGGPATVVATGLAVLVAAVGLRWLWYSTRRPHALRKRTRDLIRTWQEVRAARVEAATRILTGLDDEGGPPSAWAAFGQETGLQVPRHMRPLISRRMDPQALVAYLEAQSLEPWALERPLWVVTAIPVASCLLPAVLMIAAV